MTCIVPESKTLQFMDAVETSVLGPLRSLQTWTQSACCTSRPRTRSTGLPAHQGCSFNSVSFQRATPFPVENLSELLGPRLWNFVENPGIHLLKEREIRKGSHFRLRSGPLFLHQVFIPAMGEAHRLLARPPVGVPLTQLCLGI